MEAPEFYLQGFHFCDSVKVYLDNQQEDKDSHDNQRCKNI